MLEVEAISIESRNTPPLPGHILTLSPWMAPRDDLVAQRWPVTRAMEFTPVQT